MEEPTRVHIACTFAGVFSPNCLFNLRFPRATLPGLARALCTIVVTES